MHEIRIHGRGGQGAVSAAELLARAAFKDGKYSQAFPYFGVERRGAPVQAFCRIDDRFIRMRQNVYEPDCVIVLDSTLLDVVDVEQGLKENGLVVLNTRKRVDRKNVKTIDATSIALETLGRPIVNTVMLGAFAPLIAAVIMIVRKEGWAGVKQFFRKALSFRIMPRPRASCRLIR